MGLNFPSCALLMRAREQGVSYENTVTIGRQQMYLTGREMDKLGIRKTDRTDCSYEEKYCETFVREYLGAQTVSSLDYSDYQRATMTHDLCKPVPSGWHQSYNALIDGGALEHVFNVPVALANYFKLLKVGGVCFIFVPANNYCGHGLYQFSPELFFSISNDCNGVEVEGMTLVCNEIEGPLYNNYTYYEMQSPTDADVRCEIKSTGQIGIYVQMRKLRHDAGLQLSSYQNDYVKIWNGPSTPRKQEKRPLWRRLAKSIYEEVKPLRPVMIQMANMHYWRKKDVSRVSYCKRISESRLLHGE